MSQVAIAERIAREAHAGQVEESTGDPYVWHLERVVSMVDGDEEKAVAWLHDVLEDCPDWTGGRLEAVGVSLSVILSILTLTRAEGETYKQYIGIIARSDDPVVRAVKIADLRDHLRPNCPARLRPRYERALARLTAGPAVGEDG